MGFPKSLRKAVNDDMPKFNPGVKYGFASLELKDLHLHISSYLRETTKAWPDSCQYLDCRVCLPEEVLANSKIGKNNDGQKEKYSIEVSESTTYDCVLRFKLGNGDIVERPIALPYTKSHRYSEIILNDAPWVVTPVIADSIVTIASKDVFIRLETAKLTFKRLMFTFIKNGEFEVGSVIHSQIHHLVSTSNEVKAKHATVHYLLARYGFSEMFRRFTGIVPEVGNSNTVNTQTHPPAEWHIFRNTKQYKKKAYNVDLEPLDLSIAVRREEYNDDVKMLLSGVLYICSFFDDASTQWFDNTSMWKVLLGKVIFGCNSPENRLLSNVSTHILTTDLYLDHPSKIRLSETEINGESCACEDFYDLLALVTKRFQSWIYGSNDIYELWGKNISARRWVAEPWIQAINRLTMELLQQSRRGKDSPTRVLTVLRRYLNRKTAFKLPRTQGCFVNPQTPGDLGIFGVMHTVAPQRRAHKVSAREGSGRKSRFNANDTAYALRSAMVWVYSIAAMAKSAPFGDTSLNPFVYTVNGRITRPTKAVAMSNMLRTEFVRALSEGNGEITLVDEIEDLEYTGSDIEADDDQSSEMDGE